MEKLCPRCNVMKSVQDYHVNRNRKDGIATYCKPCSAEKWREYVNNKDSKRALKGRKEYVEPPTKTCTRCKITKDIEEFTVRTERKNGRVSRCRGCMSDLHAEWRKRNPSASRLRNLKSKYGITREDYLSLLDSQGGVCAVCKKEESTGGRSSWLYVDHCHRTGLVRGLLCSKCNKGLGMFEDDMARMESAIGYLRSFQDK